MKQPWFRKTGWKHLSVNGFGFWVVLLLIALLAPIGLAVIRNGQPVTDDLYTIFIYVACTAMG